MADIVQPIAFAALFWWFSTGAILWLIGRSPASFKWTALGATVSLLLATVALLALRDQTGIAAAYGGFAAGVALWAWHEVMFLLGYISGPRKTPCPPGLTTWPRFVASTQTVITHELVIALHAVIILVMSWGAANQIAAWTFFLLWGMRISAKLIVFFGAPNISDSFMPSHLDYLKSYFGKRRASSFFVAAITVVTSATALITFKAASAPLGGFDSAGLIMVATLAGLALFEHWALVAPVPDAALWKWAAPANTKHAKPSQWRR